MVKQENIELILNELMISNALLRRSVTLDPNTLLAALQNAGHHASYVEVLRAIPSFIEELQKTGALEKAFIAHFLTPETPGQ